MSFIGGNYDEMSINGLTDDEIERIFTASSNESPLAEAFADIRGSAMGMPSEDFAVLHVTRAASEALLLAQATTGTNLPARRSRKLRRTKPMWKTLATPLLAKIVFGTIAVAAATTGGLAATNHLPDNVQTVVADASEHVGINLPRPESDSVQTADLSQDSETVTDKADAQDAVDTADVADIADVAEAPDAAETPDVAEAPDAAETPDVAEAPDAAETPDVAEAPDAADTTSDAVEAPESGAGD